MKEEKEEEEKEEEEKEEDEKKEEKKKEEEEEEKKKKKWIHFLLKGLMTINFFYVPRMFVILLVPIFIILLLYKSV